MNTNEFAKLCKVTKRTLFHYDEIGLLKPAVTHENGFREYSPGQVYKMDTIKIFQRAGYSLNEIMEIYELGPSEMALQLKAARKILEDRILELSKMSSFLKNKLKLYEDYKRFGSWVIADVYEVACEYRIQSDEEHFFSFLQDEFNELILIDTDQKMTMLQASEDLRVIEGYSFFLEIDSDGPDLIPLIKEKIRENDLEDPLEYHIAVIPHALVEKENRAIVRVILEKR